MPDATRPIFSIGALSRMLALPPATIRTWESRYRLVVPERSPGGQRLYTRAQVEQLRFVRDEIAGGRRPADAHRLLAERSAVPRAANGHAGALLRQLFEEGGYVVVGTGALTEPPPRRSGVRVLAVVPPGAAEPPADAVLRLPAAPHDVLG